MYQSTISKNLTPTREDRRSTPPSYELAPFTSNTSSVEDYFEGISLPASPELAPVSSSFPNLELTDDESQHGDANWTDTILENAHKLKRLTSVNKEVSKCLSIEIVLTETIGKLGQIPKKIDPLSCEFKQGDYIYGYVLITNKTEEDIPFDMFSVVLEGCAIFGSNGNNNLVPQNTSVNRFLTMFDFNASWNDACLDRLITDHNDPYRSVKQFDHTDNTYTQLDEQKILIPKITYKKFFTFRIPEKLLDCSCNHGLVKHLQLPPTLGISRDEIITTLRQKWKDKTNDTNSDARKKYASLTNDLAFNNASISYSVSARIIGKASDYKSLYAHPIPNSAEDEYVVANEDYCYIRLIPCTNAIFELNRSSIDREATLLYTNMIERIEEKIELGRQLSSMSAEDRITSPPTLQPTQSALELSKMQQSYISKKSKSHSHDIIEVFLSHKKKQVFGGSKVLGLIALSTQKVACRLDYDSLSKFNTIEPSNSTILNIPMELSYIPATATTSNVPDFKKISVDLIALTIKSKHLPIPLVFHSDMLFNNKMNESDNFDLISLRKFQKYAIELSKLLKIHGEDLQIEKDLVYDLKSLANLATKYDTLKLKSVTYSLPDSPINHNSFSSIPWQHENMASTSSESHFRLFKKFNLKIDIADALLPGSATNEFCLIPDFQFCSMARIYYFKITLRNSSGEKLCMKVPMVLQRSRHQDS
ncbi:ubiquitination pathway protein [Scheffersomyces amazonensis]|uniref:ubiquitination pathway protein n=1 Tax=Scheffersomyces amazonensis TaxID=1078765 RepID=UPI00315CFB92